MIFARRARARFVLAAAAIAASAGALAGGSAPAAASTGELTMMQDNAALAANPLRTLQIFRSLGVEIVRIPLLWSQVAADPGSSTPPSNPYPDANWAPYDKLLIDARRYGIQVDLMPTGPSPLWATAPGAPAGFAAVWEPSAAAYGQFVRATATRYDGTHLAPGSSAPLPRISFWEFWNEGNWAASLAPQVPSAGSSLYIAAAEDRSLIDQAWAALQQTGHGHDTTIYASLSPDQSQVVVPASSTSISPPLSFLRALYCVDSAYRPLRDAAARALGCPASLPAGEFVADHPALFRATGVGVHPYGYGNPPTRAAFPNANSVEFSEIPQLTRALSRIMRTYHSRKSLAIYNTEYGYEPRPPQTSRQFPPQTVAAQYINWAEYLSYKNPRIATYDQYELYDGNDWFTTGLISPSNRILPSFYAFRMPIWLPLTTTRRGRTLELWGCVRPAHYASVDTGRPQYAVIQFAPGSSGRFRNFRTVRIGNPRGYIDLRLRFPGGGQVRLAWEYPVGDPRLADPLFPGQRWVYSRTVRVTLR